MCRYDWKLGNAVLALRVLEAERDREKLDKQPGKQVAAQPCNLGFTGAERDGTLRGSS